LYLRLKDILLVIAAYVDETGHPDSPDKDTFGFGGFIGKVEDWAAFDKAWRATCPVEVFPFHMMDFAARIGAFASWNEKKRRSVLGALIEVIKKNRIVPIGTVVSLKGYRSLHHKTRKRIGNIYFFVLSHFFAQVALSIQAKGSECDRYTGFSGLPPLSIVFANSQYAGRVQDWWWGAKTNAKGPLSTLLSCVFVQSISVGTPHTVTQLQASDIWAYEIGHHFDHVLPNKKPLRWPYQQILSLPANDIAQPSFEFLPKELLKYGEAIAFGGTLFIG
jgi:hypothetical protein